MTFKLASIILVLSCLTLCWSLTPEELQTYFSFLQTDLMSKIEVAITEVNNYSELFNDYYINQTQSNLAGDLEAASQSYWNKLLALQVEAAEQNIDIVSCVKYSVEQFNLLLNNTLVESNTKLNNIISSEASSVNIALALFETFVQNLSELEVKIIKCSDETCSTELDSELNELYGTAYSEIDNTLVSIMQYVTEEVPVLLENVTVDSEKYQEKVEPLIEAVEACL